MESPQASDSAISFWGQFISPEMEARFRRHQWPQEVRQSNIALGLGIASALPFIPMDYRIFGPSAAFWTLLVLRSAWVLFSLALLALVQKPRFAPYIDHILTSWCVIGSLGILLIGYTRPPAYIVGYFVSALGPSLLVYFVLPLPLLWQVASCSLGLVGNAYLLVLRQAAVDPVSRRALVVNYLLANFMGAMVAFYMHRLRRQQFTALQREISLRAGLEEALSQVKTLQGYLPICAHCKAVRNDEGYWQQVEVYVRENSMAEFTHGICPKCMQEHFGDAIAAKAS